VQQSDFHWSARHRAARETFRADESPGLKGRGREPSRVPGRALPR
jgi:hypothetical protein